jgi:hypothetical protein
MARKRTSKNSSRNARWTVEPVRFSASDHLIALLVGRIVELERQLIAAQTGAAERVIQ